METLIQNYIKNLTINDIVYFAKKNNIDLTEAETTYIFKTLKDNYQILLSDNYMEIFNNSKNYLTPSNYEKILNLYLSYRKKYFSL